MKTLNDLKEKTTEKYIKDIQYWINQGYKIAEIENFLSNGEGFIDTYLINGRSIRIIQFHVPMISTKPTPAKIHMQTISTWQVETLERIKTENENR
jgi:hypothetical protein